MTPRFKHVHFAGDLEPAFHDNHKSLWEICDDFARSAKSAGASALQVNFLAEPYGPIHLLYPAEIYHYFTGYGANLDCFVESSYSIGLWPRFLLETNLNRLRLLAEAADRYGMSALLYLCEPRLQREEIFQRYPLWRGPRVDNPAISITPLYSLNTACEEVRDHYRQLLQNVLKAAPNIKDIVLFSQDSGSGFSHVHHLYSGPNGGYLGKGRSPVERVLEFCRALVDEGRKVHSDFEVTLTTSYSDQELEEMYQQAGNGVSVAIRGAMSWTGGLEDQWAWNDCRGGAQLRETGFEASRNRRIEEFQGRCSRASEKVPEVAAMCSAPNDNYFNLKYVPNPWEQLEIIKRYEGWGVRRIFGRGFLTDPKEFAGNVNQAALAKFVAAPGVSPEEAVRQVVAEALPMQAETVLQALRLVATAVRQRANYCTFLDRTLQLFPGALVPDPRKLRWEELQDWWSPVFDTMRRIRGNDCWMPNLTAEDFAFIDLQYRELIVPKTDEAIALLVKCHGESSLNLLQQEFLQEQITATKLFRCLQRTGWNTARMTLHWRGREADRSSSPDQIVEDEIENTQEWIRLLRAAPEKWIRLSPYKGAIYSSHREIVETLKNRVPIMQRHAWDAIGRFSPAPVRGEPAFIRDWDHSFEPADVRQSENYATSTTR